jgi:hypothetical protein
MVSFYNSDPMFAREVDLRAMRLVAPPSEMIH